MAQAILKGEEETSPITPSPESLDPFPERSMRPALRIFWAHPCLIHK